MFDSKKKVALVLLPAFFIFTYNIFFQLVLLVLLFPVFYFGLTYIDHVRKLNDYPPGPFPLPYLGNLHLMGERPHEAFKELAKKYGDVFSVSLGMERTVIINNIDPAREVLVKKGKIFAGRPDTYAFKLFSRNGQDVAFSDFGPYWVKMRKLAHSSMNLFIKDNKMEGLLIIEAELLNKRLRQNTGVAIDPKDDIGLALANVICNIAFGNRYEKNDEEFQEIMRFIELILPHDAMVSVLPKFWMKIFPTSGIRQIHKGMSIRDPILRGKVLSHIETFEPNNIRDILDSMLSVRNDNEFQEKGKVSKVTDDQLEMMLNDFLIAGIEITLSSVRWLIVYLLRWPQYQEMMYKEIVAHCGHDRYPLSEDKPFLPIVQGVIQETLRMASPGPLGLPHKSVEKDTISGRNIPKDTQVMINIWACHYDERHWENPHEFNPLRWIDEEGQCVPGKHISYLPFSAGRRNCLGTGVAKAELFLIISRLITDFSFEKDPNEPLPSLEGELGVTLYPHPFKVIFNTRN